MRILIDNGNTPAAPTIHSPSGRFLSSKTPFSPSQEPEKTPEKCSYCVTGGMERSLHENRAYQTGKDHRYMV